MRRLSVMQSKGPARRKFSDFTTKSPTDVSVGESVNKLRYNTLVHTCWSQIGMQPFQASLVRGREDIMDVCITPLVYTSLRCVASIISKHA